MTEQQPITPPPELLHQWATEYWGNPGESIGEGEKYIATQAARWGADQELEACCEWLVNSLSEDPEEASQELRAARRPRPPSLKELALAKLPEHPENMASHLKLTPGDVATIRRALEQTND